MRRRRALLLTAGTLVSGLGVAAGVKNGSSPPSAAGETPDLAERFRGLAASLSADAPYRPPTTEERVDAVTALSPLFEGHAPDAYSGFTVTTGTDPATGRGYALVINERGTERAWGVYLVDLGAPVRLAVDVPHPKADLETDQIGLALFRAVPGSILLMAGAHRRAADGAGDVAHRTDSLFHAMADELAQRKVPQAQLHGFHDNSLEDTDVVISPGATETSDLAREIAAGFDDVGAAVCRSWEKKCGELEGKTNEQGKSAKDHGSVFLHVEMSRSVREDPRQWGELVRVLASVLSA